MSAAVATINEASIVESVIAVGDLSKLSPADRTRYLLAVCESLGLNPLTKPFEYITLNGKLTLYARKDATEQLRKKHHVSLVIVNRERIDDVYTVTARATDPNGRTDESIGAVAIGGLKGDALCNAIMKAETKAKRRVTLSFCGLGMLDEAELETIPQPVTLNIAAAREVIEAERAHRAEPEPDANLHIVPPAILVESPVRPVKLEGVQPTEAPKIGPKTQEMLDWMREMGWLTKDLANYIYMQFKGLGVDDEDAVKAINALNATQKKALHQMIEAEYKSRNGGE